MSPVTARGVVPASTMAPNANAIGKTNGVPGMNGAAANMAGKTNAAPGMNGAPGTNPANPNLVVGGTPGNGTQRFNDSFGWTTADISAALSIRLALFGLMAPFAAALRQFAGRQ